MPRLTDAREQILAAAETLVQTLGYSAFSYQDLADRLGIRKASIHYHFPSKEDLAVALLEQYRQRFLRWTEDQARRSRPARHRLDAYFALFEAINPDGRRICLGGVFGTEWNVVSRPVQDALRSLQEEQQQWLEETLRAGREAGELRSIGTPWEQAELVMAAAQGGMQLGRVVSEPGVLRTVGRQLLETIAC